MLADSRLKELTLNGNGISDVGALALAEGLRTNTRLEVLSLSHNDISNKGAKALIAALKSKHSHLKWLDLSSNLDVSDHLLRETGQPGPPMPTPPVPTPPNRTPKERALSNMDLSNIDQTLSNNRQLMELSNFIKIHAGVSNTIEADEYATILWNEGYENVQEVREATQEDLVRVFQNSNTRVKAKKLNMILANLKRNGHDPSQDQLSEQQTTNDTATKFKRFSAPRIALVIGNSYQKAKEELHLKETMTDAKQMQVVLTKLGFQVTLVLNAAEGTLKKAIGIFGEKVRRTPGVALFYFSGHGVSLRKENYLIPDDIETDMLDNNVPSEDTYQGFLSSYTVSLERMVLPNLRQQKSVGIVILDACRTQLLLRSHKIKGAVNGGLVHPKPEDAKGFYLAYAAAEGEAARTVSWKSNMSGMSVYTYHLTKLLGSPESKGIGIDRLFEMVNTKVKRDTSDGQRPYRDGNYLNIDSDSVHLHPDDEQEQSCPAEKVLPKNLLFSKEQHCDFVFMSLLASQAAYSDPKNFLESQTKTLARFMYPTEDLHMDGTAIFHTHYGNSVIVAIRGTLAKAEDIMTDLQITTTRVPEFHGSVHDGFYQRSMQYDQLLEAIIKFVKEGKRVIMTGHSLGAAVAAILTLRLLLTSGLDHGYHSDIFCVGFASPLLADNEMAKFIHEKYQHHFHFYVHSTDIVPRMLLLHDKVLKELAKGLAATGILEMTRARIQEALIPVLQICLNALAPGYGGMLAGAAYNVLEQKAQQFAGWYATSAVKYASFGTFLFCDGNGIESSGNQQHIHTILKYSHIPDAESIYNHQLRLYSHCLEQLHLETKAASTARQHVEL